MVLPDDAVHPIAEVVLFSRCPSFIHVFIPSFCLLKLEFSLRRINRCRLHILINLLPFQYFAYLKFLLNWPPTFSSFNICEVVAPSILLDIYYYVNKVCPFPILAPAASAASVNAPLYSTFRAR